MTAEQLADRLDVMDIHRHYAFCLDSRQPRLLDEVFSDDVEAVYGYGDGGVWHGVAEVIAGIEEKMESFEASCHFIGNVGASIDGDSARTTAYVAAWHWLTDKEAPAERPADFMFSSVYIDDVRREGERWRIARRRCRPLGPTTLAYGAMPPQFRPGS